jgi:endoglucanase Acf2
LYQNTAVGESSQDAPRLRATIARGSPYMWVEYPDGFPAATPANYPMLQVNYSNPQASAPVLYLPNSNFTTTSTQSNWAGTSGSGTQGAGANANAIAFTVNGRNYAAFGPAGSYWTWIYDGGNGGITKLLLSGVSAGSTTNYIVVATLPQNLNLATMAQKKTLAGLIATFKTYAFQRPGNTGAPSVANFQNGAYKLGTVFQPNFNKNSKTDNVTGAFAYNLVNVGTGGAAPNNQTLFALFPHQQANLAKVTGTDKGPFGTVYLAKYQYTSSRGFATNQTESRNFGNPAFYNGNYNGQMRLAQGTGFVLQYTMPPVLAPVLPQNEFQGNQNTLTSCLGWDYQIAWGSGTNSGNDSYGWGKLLSAVANNYMIAQFLNFAGSGGIADLDNYLKTGLEGWFNAETGASTQPVATGFAYDPSWNVLLPYPPGVCSPPTNVGDGFYVVRLLNDMHFHYGYFIRAAAVYGKFNPDFVTQYGGMVEHLIRNLAADYTDQPNGGGDTAIYPPYRFFDPYIGSSSAAGGQQYSSGINQESWSEAVNAWYGMLLWAYLTNNSAMLNRAAYMYASETDCARRYVFNEDAVTSGNFYLASNTFCNIYDTSNSLANFFPAPGTPAGYQTPNFSREGNHAIEWLPFGGGALYLSLNQNNYQRKNYQALVNQPPANFEGGGGTNFVVYNDLIYMYQAIFDPAGSQAAVNAVITADPLGNKVAPPSGWLDNGDSLAFLYHWVNTLPQIVKPSAINGHYLQEISATHPFSSVTRRALPGAPLGTFYEYTYRAYNPGGSFLQVKFSDGHILAVGPKRYGKQKLRRWVLPWGTIPLAQLGWP